MQFNQANDYRLRVTDFFPAASIMQGGTFDNLDETDTTLPGALVYCQNLYYLLKAKENPHASAIICPAALAEELADSEVAVIAAHDPRRLFFDLYVQLKESR